VLTNTLPGPSASEVTTFWRYTDLFIIIIIIILAHQHNACIIIIDRWRTRCVEQTERHTPTSVTLRSSRVEVNSR